MLYDITPPVTEALAVWPGDTPPTREILLDLREGDNLTLSTLKATVHLGAHADAPSHYGRGAPSIDEVPLDRYLGPCQVIRVRATPGKRFGREAIDGEIRAERVLLATGTYPEPERFREDFAALDPDLVDHLHERGVVLIGIDTPSVDLFESKDLPTHTRMLAYGLVVLEGLVLDAVPEGIYELVALPLRLVGFDASPVRAVLRD
jgi:arylformamidase